MSPRKHLVNFFFLFQICRKNLLGNQIQAGNSAKPIYFTLFGLRNASIVNENFKFSTSIPYLYGGWSTTGGSKYIICVKSSGFENFETCQKLESSFSEYFVRYRSDNRDNPPVTVLEIKFLDSNLVIYESRQYFLELTSKYLLGCNHSVVNSLSKLFTSYESAVGIVYGSTRKFDPRFLASILSSVHILSLIHI